MPFSSLHGKLKYSLYVYMKVLTLDSGYCSQPYQQLSQGKFDYIQQEIQILPPKQTFSVNLAQLKATFNRPPSIQL